jgi:hypothetical protein
LVLERKQSNAVTRRIRADDTIESELASTLSGVLAAGGAVRPGALGVPVRFVVLRPARNEFQQASVFIGHDGLYSALCCHCVASSCPDATVPLDCQSTSQRTGFSAAFEHRRYRAPWITSAGR